MWLFRPVLFGVLAFFAGVALFLGSVTLITSLMHGAISFSYTVDGKPFAETVTQAVDPGRYWRMVGLTGVLPVTLGAGTLWYAVRRLRLG